MPCDQVIEKLELYVLDSLRSDEQQAVEAHIRVCARCRASEVQYRELIARIRRTVRAAPSGGPSEQAFLAVVGAEIAATRRRQRRRWAFRFSMAVAASAFLAIGIRQTVLSLETHSGASTPAAAPRASIPQVWQLVGARAVATSSADAVAISGHRMYVLLNDGPLSRVAALEIVSGKELWRSQVRSAGYLAAGGNRVCCLAPDGDCGIDLVAIHAATGALAWRLSVPAKAARAGPVRPVVLDGGRVCWNSGDAVMLIDASNGRVAWSKPIKDEGLLSGVAARGGYLYFATSTVLYCLDTNSGSESWTMPLNKPASSLVRPLVTAAQEGVVVAVRDRAGGSRLICVDSAGPRLVWDRLGPDITSLLAAQGCLLVRGQNVRALDWKTGQELWSFHASGCGPVTHFDGRVYFVDSGKPGRLVAIDAGIGQKTWELAGLTSCDAFNKVRDTGYLKTQDGVVHAIALALLPRDR